MKQADTLLLVCALQGRQGDFAKNVYRGLCGGYVLCSQCSHKNWSNLLECFTRGGGLPPAHAETGGSRQRESGGMATCFITFTPFPSATTNIKDCEGNHGSSCWRQCGIRSHPLWWRRQFGVGSQSQRLISATRCKCLRMNIRGYSIVELSLFGSNAVMKYRYFSFWTKKWNRRKEERKSCCFIRESNKGSLIDASKMLLELSISWCKEYCLWNVWAVFFSFLLPPRIEN